MNARAPRQTGVAPLALTPKEAAESLGMSVTSFDLHVRHEVRVIRRGRLILIPVRELERWLDANASRVLA